MTLQNSGASKNFTCFCQVWCSGNLQVNLI